MAEQRHTRNDLWNHERMTITKSSDDNTLHKLALPSNLGTSVGCSQFANDTSMCIAKESGGGKPCRVCAQLQRWIVGCLGIRLHGKYKPEEMPANRWYTCRLEHYYLIPLNTASHGNVFILTTFSVVLFLLHEHAEVPLADYGRSSIATTNEKRKNIWLCLFIL